MMENGRHLGQGMPGVTKPAVLKQEPKFRPFSNSVMGVPPQPYVDRQKTENHWKSSDKTPNGHRETEGSEAQTRAVQKSETKTPNGVSVSTVEEMASEVTSKTVETSHHDPARVGYFVPSLLSHNGLPATGMNGSATGFTEEKTCKAANESFQCHVDQPSLQLNHGGNQQTKPYVDRQETFSQSKTSEVIPNGRKETESQEQNSNAVQYSVSHMPDSTVSKTVEEKSLQSSFSSSETSTQLPPQARASTTSASDQSSNMKRDEPPAGSSGGQSGLTKPDGTPASTFLQSISKYLFSWSDATPSSTSATPRSGAPEQPSVPSTVQAPGPTSGSCVDVQKRSSQSEISERVSVDRKTTGLNNEAALKTPPSPVATFKTKDENDGTSLHEGKTRVVQVSNIAPVKAPVHTAFPVDNTTTSQVHPTNPPSSGPTSLSSSKVDFKTGLHFFQAETGEIPSVQQTQLQSNSATKTADVDAKSGGQEYQTPTHVVPNVIPPACFASKPWAPVKPPVPVKKVQTAPLQQTYSVDSSKTDESRRYSFPTVSSAYPSSTSLTSTSEIFETPAASSRMQQATADAAIMKQTRRVSDFGPVSAVPFPGRKAELKHGSLHRANSLPSQDDQQRTVPGVSVPDMGRIPNTFSGKSHQELSDTTFSEATGQKQSRSESCETLKSSVGQMPSLDSLSSQASVSQSALKGTAPTSPYVDQQETVSKSKVSEKTDRGHREAETEETKRQSVQQAVSRTPTMSSSTTVEEQSTHTVSQSKETVYGPSGQSHQNHVHVQLQGLTSRAGDMFQQSGATSKLGSSLVSNAASTPKITATPSLKQTKLLEEKVMKSCDESQTFMKKSAASDAQRPTSNVLLATPQHLTTCPPYVDKQETYNHSKTSEKTDTGHRDSETAEKKRSSHEQSVSRTPNAVTSTTVDEESTMTMSETKETSSGYVTMPAARSASCGFPSSSAQDFDVLQSVSPKPAGTSHVEQKREQSTKTLSNETSEHQVKYSPMMSQNQQNQQRQHRTEHELKSKDVPDIHRNVPSKEGHVNQTPTASEVQLRSQPIVDRQETFNRSKTAEKTETGTKETDVAEKTINSLQHSFTRSPSMTSSTTTEEKCYQSMSETQETSGGQIFRENPKKQTMAVPETTKHNISPSYVGTSAAPKRTSTSIQRTQSVDERGRTSREYVIPISLAGDETDTTSRTQSSQENRAQRQSASSQRQSASSQRREHIIPVQLSPFPARRTFLQENAATRRYSAAPGWPEVDWGQPMPPMTWLTPEWPQPAAAAAVTPHLWPETDRRQPAFCCPVVSGPQAAALASLYSSPTLAGSADRAA